MPTSLVLRSAFDEYLRQYPEGNAPAGLYDPVRYAMMQSGKRIRPVLLLLSYCLYRGDFKRALPAALAVEYFHNFTLVHDDIMDAASLRHGKATVHSRFGNNSAILSGDLMLIRSFDLLLAACGEQHAHKVIGEFCDIAAQICEGQQLDMDYEQQDAVTVNDYQVMVEKKTAVLLGCALHIGALLADASPQEAEELNDIGVNLGKAFQIQDDLLDAYGEVEQVGKRRGGDILQKKKSILYALAWESSTQVGRNSLAELYNKDGGNPEVKIQQVLKVFEKHDVRNRAENLAMHLTRNAMQGLDQLVVSGEQLVVLRDFIQGLLNRIS